MILGYLLSGADSGAAPQDGVTEFQTIRCQKLIVHDGTPGKEKIVLEFGEKGENGRVHENPQSYEPPAWMLPAGTTIYGQRISIVRVRNKDGTPLMGHAEAAWKRFDRSAHTNAAESTY